MIGLRRWTSRPATIFTIVVAVGFVLSFIPRLTSDMSGGTVMTLAFMHPVPATAALVLLRPQADRSPTAPWSTPPAEHVAHPAPAPRRR
ncbi:hypothetical protein BH23ACT3_BH23ACT3_09500 [soil metagenome]